MDDCVKGKVVIVRSLHTYFMFALLKYLLPTFFLIHTNKGTQIDMMSHIRVSAISTLIDKRISSTSVGCKFYGEN